MSDPVSKTVTDVLPPGRVKDILAGTWLGHPNVSVLRGPATEPQPAYETRVQDGTIEVRRAAD